MKYRKILFIIICYFAYTSSVSADLCDKEHIKELKELANQVEANYEYLDYTEEIKNNPEGEYPLNSYLVSVNLISNELYIKYNNYDYYYTNENNGLIEFVVNSGKVNFTVHSDTCAGHKLRSVSLNLPKFNTYFFKAECKELSEYELDICDPWYQGTINDSYFYNTVNKYLNVPEKKETFIDKVIKFYNDYQLIIVGSVLLLILAIIGVISYRKRSVLE